MLNFIVLRHCVQDKVQVSQKFTDKPRICHKQIKVKGRICHKQNKNHIGPQFYSKYLKCEDISGIS